MADIELASATVLNVSLTIEAFTSRLVEFESESDRKL